MSEPLTIACDLAAGATDEVTFEHSGSNSRHPNHVLMHTEKHGRRHDLHDRRPRPRAVQLARGLAAHASGRMIVGQDERITDTPRKCLISKPY